MIELITQKKLDSLVDSREEGVSGLMRVRNEIHTLERSILSVMNILDELVIIYHDCTDGSKELILSYADRFPDKIKAYEYTNRVIPANSGGYVDGFIEQESLANYYNFGLSKCSFRWFMKVDADQIYIESELRELFNNRQPGKYYCMVGFLTTVDTDKDICVHLFEGLPINGHHGDHFLTEIKRGSCFKIKKRTDNEYFQCEQYYEPDIKWSDFDFSLGGAFWHHVRQYKDRPQEFYLDKKEKLNIQNYINFRYLRNALPVDKFTDIKIEKIVKSFFSSISLIK